MESRQLKSWPSFRQALCLFVLLTAPAFAAVPDGYVVSVESATVYLDWGKASGAQSGDHFTVYRPGEPLKHPVTGEILGRAEEALGSGTLERIEDKFSIGHFSDARGDVKPGDRARWQEPPPPAVLPSVPAAGKGSEDGLASLPELWRSDPIKEEAVGIAMGNVLGEGQQDIVVAFRNKIQVFRWKENHLEPSATYQATAFRRWLAVDTGDLKGEGRDEIFATAWLEGLNRPRVVVLRWADGQLRAVADFEGFVRAFNHSDGHRHLLWQNLSRSRDFSFTAPCELAWASAGYRPGPPMNLHLRDDQLFGFAWGAWGKDNVEDFAVLMHGAGLRVAYQDARWSSNETYGGTKNDLYIEDRQAGSLFPRLASWRVRGADRDQLIALHNVPTLGINLTYLKLFNKAELTALTWNGLTMQPAWRLTIPGYLADFTIGDAMRTSTPQLWLAGVGAGDKTVLLAYRLP